MNTEKCSFDGCTIPATYKAEIDGIWRYVCINHAVSSFCHCCNIRKLPEVEKI